LFNLFKQLIKERHLILINLYHPCRAINSFLALLSYKLKLIKPLGKPIVIDMEPTNFCNLRCEHCQVTHWDKAKKRLTMEKFKKWIRHFSLASRIKLQGMGEPFLNKELPDIIKELEKKSFYIKVISNGTILTDAVHEAVTQTKNFCITISFDGADKKIFEKIRIGSNFDKIKENITKIINSKSRKSKVSTFMVGFEENKEQIKPTIELMAKLGVEEFHLRLFVINFGQNDLNSKTLKHQIKFNNKVHLKDEFLDIAKKNNIKMHLSNQLYDEKNQCPWPWLGTYVDTEGYVIPCCCIGNAEIYNFGNLDKEDFHTIWYSKKYQQFRRQIRSNDIPKFCRSCYKPHVCKNIN